MSAPNSQRPDASAVSAELARRIQSLCNDLLSSGRRSGAYWTVGGVDNVKGASMWVHLHGEKQGHWQDAATGEFGDALDLLAACRYGGDKKAAYAAALAWLGWSDVAAPPARPAPVAQSDKPDERTARNRAYALRLYLEAHPALAGTPVESYLRDRGIDLAQMGRQPRALRYHPSLYHRDTRTAWPAMVAAINDGSGAHLATHRTYLERAGGGWMKLRNVPAKLSLGDFVSGSIRIWRGASKRALVDAAPEEPIVIGEGIETCLSIAIACPELRVLCAVSLSNMASVWLPPQTRMVVLAADNDTHPQARQALQRAVNAHIAAGREVRVARARDGNDFNDVLQGAA